MRNPLFFFLLLLVACGSPDVEQVEKKLDDGSIERFDRRTRDFARHGWYRKFFPNGNTAEISYYQNDTLHGERKLFYPNGTLETLETYQNGLFHGPFRHFYENGVLEIELPYLNNAIEGEAKAYYPNGVLKETVHFKANEEFGPFREFYDNGNLKAEGRYTAGEFGPVEDGELKEYDENGQLVRRAMCANGICNTVWKREGE